jgi:trans-aconitate methyltransferase
VDEREVEELLEEQTRYYRARAATYDLDAEWASELAEIRKTVAPVHDWFAELPLRGDVLELGCGTGLWTAPLARRAEHLHAVDVAPEMVARAEARVAGQGDVTFEVADLYRWRPAADYDLVFFSLLLSHVPWHLWPRFWEVVSSSLATGGTVAFVDDARSRRGAEEWLGDGVVRRTLQDGPDYRVVKVLPTPEQVVGSMAQHGLEGSVDILGDTFLVGVGRVL